VDNLLFNNRFIFQEWPKQAPTEGTDVPKKDVGSPEKDFERIREESRQLVDSAEDSITRLSDRENKPESNEPEIKEPDMPLEKYTDFDKLTFGYPEVKNLNKYKSVINELKTQFKKSEESKGREFGEHKDRANIIGEDSHEYVLVRDNTHKPPDRLFRSPEPIDEEVQANRDAVVSTQIEEYKPLVIRNEQLKKKVEKITKRMEKEIKKEKGPYAYAVKLEDLVNARMITQEEADSIEDGDAVCVYKNEKNKHEYYVGWWAE